MKSIILWVLFSCVMIAQPRSKSFLWEVNSFPQDSGYAVYLTYKISYDLLVFVKKNDKFTSGVKCFAEIYRNDSIVDRNSGEASIGVSTYEETNSSRKYLQGAVAFHLSPGEYKIIPEFDFLNSDRIAGIPGAKLTLGNTDSLQLFKPVSVQNFQDNNKEYTLANAGGVIPFSPESYCLLLPINFNSENEIDVTISNKDSVYLSMKGVYVFSGSPQIQKSSTALKLTNGKPEPEFFKYFVLDSFNKSLPEGKYKVSIIVNSDTLKNNIEIKWIDKPRSLYDPEYAIEILKNIENDAVVNILLDASDEEYYKVLKKYWKKYDRNKDTSFNEVMDEFYKRVDIADLDYNNTGSDRGSGTDRGKIFIKFGRPDDIQRSYVENNEVAELWIYNKINKKFLFKDTSGLGNYSLIE